MAVLPQVLTAALRTRYRIEGKLGRGGMATVYLAQDLKHDRLVALKVLRPELTAILGRERFLAEIRLTAKLDHPNIITLLDSGDVDGAVYYVLPYVRGGSLRQRLDQERQLSIPDAVRIGSEIASALDHAHGLGVIHRDIKPENILLRDEGTPMLTDFGIALAVREAGGERLTETGLVVGTPQYMSPEQATGDRLLDARSDLYSLGAVVYEMLAGEPAVQGSTAQAIIARLMTERPTPLRVIRSSIPASLAQAVEQSLAKVPADRFGTGAEFAKALNAGPTTVRLSQRRAVPVVAGVVAIVTLTALVGKLSRPAGAGVPPSTSVIAVLPALASVPDSGLSRLGRDLVFTLAANLTGAGEIRAVDPQTVLAQVGVDVRRSQTGDLALGRRLNAGSVVRGTLVRVGTEVRWDVVLLSTDEGKLLAQVSTTAPAESLRSFTDTATRSLLRQIWERGQPPSPSLDAAVKTRSVPALKAFLNGEANIVADRWEEAARSYSIAIAADSTFWLAYWRLWYAGAWPGVAVDSSLLAPVRDHRWELPDRERLLIEACICVAESLNVAIRNGKQVTERFPGDWFGWMFYADFLVHNGSILGYTAADARQALERTVALNPNIVEAWTHLLLMSLGKDTAGTNRSLKALDSLGWSHTRSGEVSFDVSLWYRLASQLQGSGGKVPHPLIDSVARAIALADSGDAHLWGAYGLDRFGFPGAQAELDRLIIAAGVPPRFVPRYLRSLAASWAMRGAWDSALVAADNAILGSPGEPDVLNRYRLTVFAVWLKAVDPDAASAAGRAARQAVDGLPPDGYAEGERTTLAWLDGLLALVSHDRRKLAAARAVAHSSHAPTARYVGRSLRALAGLLDGATTSLVDSLEAADASEHPDGPGAIVWTQILSIDRLTAAGSLLTLGDTARAVRLLVWHESELNGDNVQLQIFVPFAYAQLARIEEAQGQVGLAREHYEQFLRRYDRPVPQLLPLVERARAALAKQSSSSGAR